MRELVIFVSCYLHSCKCNFIRVSPCVSVTKENYWFRLGRMLSYGVLGRKVKYTSIKNMVNYDSLGIWFIGNKIYPIV
jgi:hypothetical protein